MENFPFNKQKFSIQQTEMFHLTNRIFNCKLFVLKKLNGNFLDFHFNIIINKILKCF